MGNCSEIEKLIYESMKKRGEKPQIYNPKKFSKLVDVFESMQNTFSDDKFTVSYNVGDPFPGDGVVRVISKDFYITDFSKIDEASKKCDAFEVLAHTDGTVEMNFSFSELTDIL